MHAHTFRVAKRTFASRRAATLIGLLIVALPAAAAAQDSQRIYEVPATPAPQPPQDTSAAAAKLRQMPLEMTATPTKASEEVEAGHTILTGLNECDLMAARWMKLKGLAEGLEKTKGFLEALGKVMVVASATKHAKDYVKTGEVDGLVDDAQGLVITEGGCAAAGIFCPVYTAGMGLGTFISYAPKVFGWTDQTLNDMWTDFWVDTIYSSPTDAQIQQKIAEMRAKIQQARSDADAAQGRDAQCRAGEQRKAAVEQLLNKAKPPAVRSTSDSYTSGLFEQSAVDTSDPYSGQWLANEQNRRLSEADRITQDSTARSQAAGAALMQGLTTLSTTMSNSYTPSPYLPSAPPSVTPYDGECIASKDICEQIRTGLPPGTTIQDYQKGLSAQKAGH